MSKRTKTSKPSLVPLRIKSILVPLRSLLVLGICLGAAPRGAAEVVEDLSRLRFVEGELMVKIRGGRRDGPATRAQRALSHEVKRAFDQVGWQHIRLAPGGTVAQALVRYRQHPDVVAVEPNYVLGLRLENSNAGVTPNDPRFSEQWGLVRIGATNAWALTTGSSNVIVAMLDSGMRYAHEDLAANLWQNPGEIPANGIDDDGNGYIDDVYGIDAVEQDSDPRDELIGMVFHGTACASILGAAGNNGVGMTGLNWPVRLMTLRLAAESNYIASAWVVECFNYVVDMKKRGVNIRVTSNSYGSDDAPSLAVRDAIEAAGHAGILSVFAAGNSNKNVDVTCEYPACFQLDSMINVAASDEADTLASFSNYGATNVHLAAPGVNILTVHGFTTNDYFPQFTGTSAACPHVAGAAALLATAYPFAGIDQIKRALLESVDTLPALSNKVASNGRLNLARALSHPLLSSNASPFILANPQSQTVGLGYPASFRVIATGAGPMAYLWQFDGCFFARTTEPTLTLASVGLKNCGQYGVVLSNTFGRATSAVARLTVVTHPTILVEPQGGRVLDGTNVTLSVAAAGAFPLAYQWQRNAQTILGATEATLALRGVEGTMAGDYRVSVSNAYGVVTSAVAQLAVLTRPYILVQPQSQTVAAGANASLSVAVTNAATLPIRVQWLRNGHTTSSMLLSQFTASTNFLDIQTNLSGIWSVRVANEAQSMVSSNAYLTVVRPPADQTVPEGSEAMFSVLAVGPPPLRYRWQHDGADLSGATGPNLLLRDVQPSDAGTYSIVVSNAIGQPATFTAALHVLPSRPWLAQPQRHPDGGFRVTLIGSPGQWYAVETSSDLLNWQVLQMVLATNVATTVVDFPAAPDRQRFYRARSDP